MKKQLLAVLILLVVIVQSCSKDDGPPVVTLDVDTIGLETLTGGTSYQGWLVVDGVSKPTAKFTNPNQTIALTVLQSDAQDASGFYITVEAVGDNDNLPSDAVVLSGTFNGNSATLDFDSVVGDLANVSGELHLATYTDDDPDNDQFGVWFSQGLTAPGLSLPALGSGWKYEGWVNFGNRTVSTGTFDDPAATDDANFFRGSGGVVPNYPGEDFLILPSQIPLTGVTFPADVTNRTVFITIEPFEDRDPAPFFIRPLSVNVGAMTGADNPYTMLPNTQEPSGRVVRPN
ncbi:anti-sigma factor [Aquimarina brevivitae]|uniref:Anti-sigma-K factor rskA n=1 Tax=Aquimarina brevivitae TaxID=323412 RepID=A0A4Q7P204_9FLAO|nr:anti-sigma factor [Aquimarina brevivitae]RZS93765.1 hypothetical protein EV197_2346 [Aquimarina brevivitae]